MHEGPYVDNVAEVSMVGNISRVRQGTRIKKVVVIQFT